MKILVLSPEIPNPVFKGNQQRIDGVIRQLLHLGHEVHLAILNSNQRTRTSASIATDLVRVYPGLGRVEVRRHPKLGNKSRRSVAHRMAARIEDQLLANSLATVDTCPLSYRRLVQGMVDELRPDAVFVNYLKLSPALPDDYSGIRVVDTHDIQSNLIDQARNIVGSRTDGPTHESLLLEELSLARRFDTVIAINPNEAEEFQSHLLNVRIETIPGFAEPRPSPKPSHEPIDVLFVGSRSPFNIEAATYLIDFVAPSLWRKNPNIHIAVAGDVCTADRVANRSSRVTMLGRVDDLTRIYHEAKVIVCPLRGGAGMKIKVVEALSHGKAIVTTSVGADGIGFRSGVDGVVSDDWDDQARWIFRLLTDPYLRRAMEREALALALRDHSPESTRARLRAIFGGTLPGVHHEVSSDPELRADPERRALIFPMDARLLMGFNRDLARHLRELGFISTFIKVEERHFNFFLESGFDVMSVKSMLTPTHRQAAELFLDTQPPHLPLDQPLTYRGFDISAALSTYESMFPNHFENRKGVIAHCIAILECLLEFVARDRPEVLVGWNGDGPSMVFLMRVLGAIAGIPVLLVERGLLPHSYVVDPQGVNFKSGLSGTYLPVISDSERQAAREYITQYRERRETVVRGEHREEDATLVRRRLGLAPDERYVLFPEQIETDSNIILNSPVYKRMDHALRDVVEAASAFGLRVVCRPHPESPNRPAEVPNVIYDNSISLHGMLDHASAVVVLNSTVGLESMLMGKPTITLAHSIYSEKGASMSAVGKDNIRDRLDDVLSGRFNAWVAQHRLEELVWLILSRYLVMQDGTKTNEQNQHTVARALMGAGVAVSPNPAPPSSSARSRSFRDRAAAFKSRMSAVEATDRVHVINALRPDSHEYWTGADRRPIDHGTVTADFCQRYGISQPSGRVGPRGPTAACFTSRSFERFGRARSRRCTQRCARGCGGRGCGQRAARRERRGALPRRRVPGADRRRLVTVRIAWLSSPRPLVPVRVAAMEASPGRSRHVFGGDTRWEPPYLVF